jgi:hypothetical protein
MDDPWTFRDYIPHYPVLADKALGHSHADGPLAAPAIRKRPEHNLYNFRMQAAQVILGYRYDYRKDECAMTFTFE